MKVLVATTETQGMFEDDYCWTVDGELVYIQSVSCPDPLCGCTRGFAGLSSARATTTAVVVDRPNLQIGDLADALSDSLERSGWLRGRSENETVEIVSELLTMLVNITEPAEPGSIVRRNGDMAYVK
jgi:hypothetical protein